MQPSVVVSYVDVHANLKGFEMYKLIATQKGYAFKFKDINIKKLNEQLNKNGFHQTLEKQKKVEFKF